MREAVRRRLGIAVFAALVLVVAGGLALIGLVGRGTPSTADSIPSGQPFYASGSLDRTYLPFGDSVRARVDVVADRRRLDPNRLRLDANFAPYEPIGPIRRTRRDIGSKTRVHYEVDLHCVTLKCLPQPGSQIRFQFEAAAVRYSGTRVAPVSLSWPAVTAVSRLDPIDLEQRDPRLPPPWQINETRLADVSYGVRPHMAFWTLLAVSALLVAASVVLLRPFLPRQAFPFGRDGPPPQPLERALVVLERARDDGVAEEERKALELLAVELGRSGQGELAWTARSLAWSPETPALETTGTLTVNVRRVIEERSNGHGH